MAQLCDVCRREARHQCSRCHRAFFCSLECQRKAWKSHEVSCELGEDLELWQLPDLSEIGLFERLARPEARGVRGIVNASVHCWINSSLQALAHATVMLPLLESHVAARTCEDGKCWRCALHKTLSAVSTTGEALRPDEVQILAMMRSSPFDLDKQQDAEEFLRFLFQKLQEEELAEQRVPDIESTLPWKIFGGCMLVNFRFTCRKRCTSSRLEYFQSLPIKVGSVDDALAECLMDEILTAECDCKDSVRAVKRTTILTPPNTLMIQLKRFGNKSKVDKAVTYRPTLSLQLAGAGFALYELRTVVNHFGSLRSGHYTCDVLQKGGRWTVSDADVEASPDIRSEVQPVYLLFYSLMEVVRGPCGANPSNTP